MPKARQAIGMKQTMITIFLTRRKLIMLGTLPKGRKFDQSCFIDYIFPDLKSKT
jgi:hypothetical protein